MSWYVVILLATVLALAVLLGGIDLAVWLSGRYPQSFFTDLRG